MDESEWIDLLGLKHRSGEEDPHTGFLDCLGVCKEVYRRGGAVGCEWTWTPIGPGWLEVGSLDEIEPYDILATDPDEVGHVTHAAVSVGCGRLAPCLSSSERAGVFQSEAWRVKGLVGIYRPT